MHLYTSEFIHRPPRPKKTKKSSTPTEDLELEILKELRRNQSDAPDEDDLFGQSIAATLKKFNAQQKALVKMRIQQLLYEVQFCPPQPPPPTSSQQFYPHTDSLY